MVKKKELKQRAIYVYPPADMAENWKNLASESGSSISKFVIEHVENSLGLSEDDFRSRSIVIEENMQLRDALSEKDKRNQHLELLVEKLEEDLRRYRTRLFTDTTYDGASPYDRQLVELLMEPGFHNTDSIFARLRVRLTDSEIVKGISAQIETLERFGLVRNTSKGWVWSHPK